MKWVKNCFGVYRAEKLSGQNDWKKENKLPNPENDLSMDNTELVAKYITFI